VPVVSHATALAAPTIQRSATNAFLPLPPDALQSLGDHVSSSRRKWQRFVAIRPQPSDALVMEPLILPDAYVVLDRHHNTLDAKRTGLYAVRRGERIVLRYVAFQEDRLILRPHNLHHKIELVEVDPDKSPNDWIVGRAVFVLNRMSS